jgi:uncharacterized damage-inducible protein DinB
MTPEQASAVLQFYLPQFEAEMQTTKRVLSAVPDDRAEYRPSEKCMTAYELVRHIALAEVWFLSGAAAGNFPKPDDTEIMAVPKTADVVAWYEKSAGEAIEKLKSVSGEHILTPVRLLGMTMPAINVLALALKHSVHHRGQLTSYLRPMGAKVPSVYGGSGDERVQSAAKGD